MALSPIKTSEEKKVEGKDQFQDGYNSALKKVIHFLEMSKAETLSFAESSGIETKKTDTQNKVLIEILKGYIK